jgi:hypothetical protein
MASYSVFEPPGSEPQSFEASERSAFVKDGWCWPALLFPPIWLLWRRMWLVFLFWLTVVVAIGVAGTLIALSDGALAILDTVFALWFALEANAMRRWTLARNGWRFAGIATGADRVDAEHRFFSRSTSESVVPARLPPRPRTAGAASSGEAVLGMFPEPWDSRR